MQSWVKRFYQDNKDYYAENTQMSYCYSASLYLNWCNKYFILSNLMINNNNKMKD